MRRTRAQGRGAKGGIGEGVEGAKNRKKPQQYYRSEVKNRGDSGSRE